MSINDIPLGRLKEILASDMPLTIVTTEALIARLEQAEQDRDKLRNRLDAMRRQRDGYRNQLRKTEQQVARVREVMADWDTDEDAKGLYFDLERALDGESNE